MFNPKLTIIILSYNQREYIADAIQSASNQTYDDLEIVTGDNGSTDGSKETIKVFAELDSRIIFLDYPKNFKITVRQNTAVQKSLEDYYS